MFPVLIYVSELHNMNISASCFIWWQSWLEIWTIEFHITRDTKHVRVVYNKNRIWNETKFWQNKIVIVKKRKLRNLSLGIAKPISKISNTVNWDMHMLKLIYCPFTLISSFQCRYCSFVTQFKLQVATWGWLCKQMKKLVLPPTIRRCSVV